MTQQTQKTAYAELQVTTNFSFLRGGSHGEELVAAAKALGLGALAVTDRNTLAGVVRAHAAAKEAGVKLIPGARLDLVDAPSLICLPADRAAYGRLSRLLSLGQRRAEKGECELYLDDVAAHAEGQIFIALPPVMSVMPEACKERGPEACECEPSVPASATIIPLNVADAARSSPSPRPYGERVMAEPCFQHEVRGSFKRRSKRLPLTLTLSPHATLRGEGTSEPSPCRRVADAPASGVEDATSFPAQLRRIRDVLNAAAAKHRQRDVAIAKHRQHDAAAAKHRQRPAAALYLAASHTYRGDDRARMAALQALAAQCGTPLVATNDVLYHEPARRPLQDVLTCIREGCTIHEAGFKLAANAERHLKAPAEMARLFRGFEDAVARAGDIADACHFCLDELVYEYPQEPVPPGKNPQAHLEDLTWEGARHRFPGGVPATIDATLRKELALIDELAYAPYFLTVHDIVSFARAQGILCQGRGSAANSAVCYCLGITAVNPLEVDLLFERFISPERREPPDIDVDFEHERREEVIQYIYARYGRERAGLAATVTSYRARSAVREVGKVMGLSADTVAAMAGMVWGSMSGDSLPQKHVREAGLDPADPLVAAVLALTRQLIGFPRHLSQHVGGFVLTRGPLTELVPVGNAAMEDRTVIEWDKDDLDTLGLLKVDVLALGMLTCIRRGFDLLRLHHGRSESLASVPREDAAVYDMLCRADSLGVFQVESRAQMNMLPRLKPRCFYDLVIEVAIVRPGPIQGDMVHPYLRRRDGLEREDYPSPSPEHGPPDELRQILGKTKGVPLFQEQAMRIAMVAARFSGAEANELRKAMATFRRRGTIGLLEAKMVERMVARGYERTFAERCFNQIKGFGEYGFPESHAASFAHLVYVSSWLKCHYPAVFACALLNSQPMGFYAPAQIVRDAREHGVTVREVDVNLSDWDCTLEDGDEDDHGPALRLGLRLIDGLRQEDAEKIMAVRDAGVVEFMPHGAVPRQSRGHLRPGAPTARVAVAPVPSSPARVKKIAGREQSDPPRRGAPPEVPSRRLEQHREAENSFTSLHDLWRRAGVPLASLEKLAAADAFRSMGLDRRQALWEVRGLSAAEPLPLFNWSDTREAGNEPDVALPRMPLSEHVVNDYQTLRLSLKAHPVSFLRQRLARQRVTPCDDLRAMKDGAWVSVAGVVLVRQRPGTAKGVVFMTIEDETGIANVVVWAKTQEKFRKVVMAARLIEVRGRIQRHEDIIHVVSAQLFDRSDWLALLSEAAQEMKVPLANADEVQRPEPGSRRERPRRPDGAASESSPPKRSDFVRTGRRHPRDMRIIPNSRDFH